MKITNVTIIPVTPKNGLIAFACIDITDDDRTYSVSSIGIYSFSSGMKITYPTKENRGKQFPIFKPKDKESADYAENCVINAAKEYFGDSIIS